MSATLPPRWCRCTALLPEPSLEQGMRLIREAAAQARSMQTPGEQHDAAERKALFEHLASEEDDKSLKAYRALAAERKSIAYRFAGAALLAGARGQPFVPDRA